MLVPLEKNLGHKMFGTFGLKINIFDLGKCIQDYLCCHHHGAIRNVDQLDGQPSWLEDV